MTDRGSHDFVTLAADGPVDRKRPTQLGARCRSSASITSRLAPRRHVAGQSGCSRPSPSRGGRLLQDRLVKELALAGIATVAAANRFIRDIYLPAHNARFAVKAEQAGTAFVAIAGGGVDLNEILCIQEQRQVGNDNTVAFHRHRLQIPPSPLRPHFVKARVKVRQYPDGTHAIFYGARCLGQYDAAGGLVADTGCAA